MRIFDSKKFAQLNHIFPELTPAQFETAMLFALGMTKKEIAWARNVSYPAVRDTLQEIKNRLEFYSLSHLVSTIHIRLVLFALCQCTLTNKEHC